MGVKISWFPSDDPPIASYNVSRAGSQSGPFATIANVVVDLMGPNYDAQSGQFFYIDTAGTTSNWYTLVAIDESDTHSPPSPAFQAQSDTPSLAATVKVDHNYPNPGSLRYQTSAGIPIQSAVIRIFKESDFLRGFTDLPLFTTQTDAAGNWASPVYLAPGYNYVVVFARESLYGPDRTTITV